MIIRTSTDTGKDVWFNTKTQMMIEIPNELGYLGKNGKGYPVFDSVDSFLKSDKEECIIYAFCNTKKKKGKRFLFNFDFYFGNVEFWSAEYTPIGWVNHSVEEVEPLNAYRMFIKKERHCINDVQIILTKKL